MSSDRPNIVLIFVDNQPANMMGCAGNDEVHTPNLDKFAGDATRFDQAFCPNAMCSPCRASVLTGLMPSQHGIHTWLDDAKIQEWPDNWNAIAEFQTLPGLLAQNQYDTALIGKYHLGLVDQPQNGFDHWVTLQTGHILSFYDNDMIVNDNKMRHPGHSVDFFTGHAVDYIQQHDSDQPFFMFLTYPAPYGHWPSIQGVDDNPYYERYVDTQFNSVPREGLSRELMDWLLIRHDKEADDDPDYYWQLARIPNDLPTLRNYYSQMSMVDNGVGQVLDALSTKGISDDTLIVYTSDHGMSLGQHGFWGHGEDTWPSNMHREANNIPLIIQPPGQPSGSEKPAKLDHSLVSTYDIFSTVLDYAGLADLQPETSPARSMRPLLEGKGPAWEDAVYMEQEETRSVRTRDWLYMKRLNPTPYDFKDDLYDLKADPGERNNLAQDAGHASICKQLSAQLDAFFASHSDPKWDLWNGGTCKSNSTRPFLWQEVWGKDWKPVYE